MATGRIRGGRRSSGTSSYSSTITTIIFVALCVLGVWLLSSNSFASLRSNSRSAVKTPTQIDSIAHSQDPKPSIKEEQSVREDVPGELPEDPIKPVDSDSNLDTVEQNQKTQADVGDHASSDSGASNESTGAEKSKDDNGKQETEKVKDDLKSDGDKKDTSDQGSTVEGEKDLEESQQRDSVEERENQKALEAQHSEESSITQNQEIKEKTEEKQDHKNHPAENGDQAESRAKGTTSADAGKEITQNEISEEDQQKRVQEHQNREDEQVQQGRLDEKMKRDPNGATSVVQIEHDEAPIQPESTKDAPNLEAAAGDISKNINADLVSNSESSEIPKESKESKKTWSTQADQSEDEKERRKAGSNDKDSNNYGYTWQLCNVTAGQDYIPCLDNEKAIAKLHTRMHYEHRERHCPDENPICLVPLPQGYKTPIPWPQSRNKVRYHNVPHKLLAEVKGHQNWVKVSGEFLVFPGGGTQFIHGALHYIDFLQEAVSDIAWGKHTRVILDVGCGVASFGGFLFDRDVLAMSLAPKDEHEAQVQFALERGIPAISAVMGSQRLQFPSRVFDIVHCARCRVPWHADGGALLLELNRVLRPGGYFVWSATPVYQTLKEDVEIWKEMTNLTVAMCWELITIKKDKMNSIGAAIYQKPESNDCYEQRKQKSPPMCKDDDDPNAAWYVPLQACMHRIPTEETARGSQWPEEWPKRVLTPPYWLNKSQMGIYGKPAPDDFAADYEHWKKVVGKSYMSNLGINWSNVRNVMDMRAVYGGFAAALKDLKIWVMNVVNVDSPDTLPIIYERGLFGIYHDWCESFSTYPRTYDLLHADHLLSKLKKRCKVVGVIVEIDRIVRPGGKLILRDESSIIGEVENMLKSLHWEVIYTFSKDQEGILGAQKSDWRPNSYAPAT